MYDFPLSGVFAKQLPSQNQVPFSVRSLVSFWVVLPIFLYWNPMVFTAKYLVVVDLLQSHIRYYQSNFCDTKPTAVEFGVSKPLFGGFHKWGYPPNPSQ